MKLNCYHLLLPEGTLDYFDLVDVKESMYEVIIYLEEKNQLGQQIPRLRYSLTRIQLDFVLA